MNRSVIFLLIVVLLGSFTLKAQVAGLSPMNKPIKYISPSEDVSISAETDINKFRPGSCWIVFSDRGNNVTYESDNSNKVKKKLELLDVYIVAEERGEWVHIVKDDKLLKLDFESDFGSLGYTNSFSPTAEDYGWIKKDHLLLWQKCITTKVGNFNKKGIVLNTVEITMKKDLKKDKSNEFYFFIDPESSISSENKSRVYEVLYIYKIDIVNKSVLLGRSERVTVAGKVKNTILGWMKLENVTIWDTRIAAEPNWNTEAAAERRSGEKAKIYRTKSQAQKYSNRAIWDQDPFEKRNIGRWRRFPVLSPLDSDGILKVGVMGELKTVGSNKTIADTEWESVIAENQSYLYMPGYTRLYVKGQKYPLFNFVLFMSNQELGNLLTVFDDLIDATTGFDQRSEMKAVWLDILEKHVGDEFSREEMENMTFEEINRKVFGLPGTSNLLTEKLSHLTNPSIISDDEIFKYVQQVARNRQKLSNIFNSEDYPYSFMSNDIKYFWISQEIIP